MSKKWKLEIEVEVSDNWIADGFNLPDRFENIKESIQSELPYAYENEIKVTIKQIN